MKNILKYTAVFSLLLPMASSDGIDPINPEQPPDCSGPLHYFGNPSDINFNGKVSVYAAAGLLGASGASSGIPPVLPLVSKPIKIKKPVQGCGTVATKSYVVTDKANNDSSSCGFAHMSASNQALPSILAHTTGISIDLITEFKAKGQAQLFQQCCSTGAPLQAYLGASAPKTDNSIEGYVTFFIPPGQGARLIVESELECSPPAANALSSGKLEVALKKKNISGEFVLYQHWGAINQSLEVTSEDPDEYLKNDGDSIWADSGTYRLVCTYSSNSTTEATVSCSPSSPLDQALSLDVEDAVTAQIRLEVMQ